MSNILTVHEKICSWLELSRTGPVRSSQPAGTRVLKRLRVLANLMHSSLPETVKQQLTVHISRGKSNLPSVLWVALTPAGRSVYESMSVTVCFSHEATGSVLGVMDAVTFPQRWLPTVERAKQSISIDLNKPRAKYKYNDMYVNPIEFPRAGFNEDLFVTHLDESCALLLDTYEKRFKS